MTVLYRIVKDDVTLKGQADFWKKQKILAMDLEMENNLHRYGTHLALIQISDGRKTWLVDPLKIKDLSPFVKMMENPGIQKVFHDADFDFNVLNEKLLCHPKNIFDTKIAAEMDGRKEFGLGSLLAEMFGVKKDVKMQKVDWTRRPLTERMKEYAAKDVIYLIRLKKILEKSLIEKGRGSWFREEFGLLERKRYEKKKDSYLIKGSKSLTGRERAILRCLFDCRETIAKNADRPAYHVIPNSKLLELAKKPPRDAEEWKNLKGVSWFVKKNAKQFAFTVKRGMRIPKEEKVKCIKPRMSHKKFEYLKEERNKIGKILEVEPYVLMNMNQMEELARGYDPAKILRKWQLRILNSHGIKL